MSWKLACALRVLIIECRDWASDLMVSRSRFVVGSSSAMSFQELLINFMGLGRDNILRTGRQSTPQELDE
jgi:hypothetical protein